ncbi:hypothetical protein JQX13_52515 [Archangium violaceum]|uniref:polymorphic toxin-type HINT domain-containing protein n=1 Tax=Archangium violaceum TaxID=83451 RepID=UPI00193B4089|nr:polymorphic toxin-type HINT domain-containing protein [Archangium violaceum]QRK08446.1 hypothetical protein JQX13_52515 [Archangium violaceum]
MTTLRFLLFALFLTTGCLGAPDNADVRADDSSSQVRVPGPDDRVRVFDTLQAEWREVRLREVPAGGEVLHEGRLLRVRTGARILEWVKDVDVRLLAEADRAFSRGPHLRDPSDTDIVRVLGAQTRHCGLTAVRPGENFVFQGRIFRTRLAATGGLEYANTGHTLSRVARTYTRPADTLIDLSVHYEDAGGESVISGTPEHPFFVPARGEYVDMGELEPGTVLHTSDGSLARVVASSKRHGGFIVHNLEVEGTHNYLISAPDSDTPAVLVHNTCGPGQTLSPALKDSPYHPDAVAARVKPEYRPSSAHDPRSPNFNVRKTPEPADAREVYDRSVRTDMGVYFGKNEKGEIYRFSSDNTGGVHFNGIFKPSELPGAIVRQLGQ